MTGETVRRVEVNGIGLALREQGTGPLVLLCHGWPELSLSWRHQLRALAEAGFRAVAPDMRGFGDSDAPADEGAYTIFHTVGDMVALLAALGETQAVIVGHDWGAPVAWNAALMRPDLFRAVVGMSVPHRPRGGREPLRALREGGFGRHYFLHFQTPGVAEAEFERDVAATLRRILYAASGDAPMGAGGAFLTAVPEGDPPQGGFLAAAPEPPALPGWLDEAVLDRFVATYRRTGFRGGLNWYRNLARNWELTAPFHGARIRVPALFIAGTRDPVILGPIGERALAAMPEAVPGLRRQVLLEGAGHWIQQERAEAVNEALIGFLREL